MMSGPEIRWQEIIWSKALWIKAGMENALLFSL
jgi:hypothetical protein